MQAHRWQADWDGYRIEVKYRTIPFSALEPSLGLYPTAEMLIDGIPVAQRAWDQDSCGRLTAAVLRADGGETPISVHFRRGTRGPGCEIRVDGEVLDLL